MKPRFEIYRFYDIPPTTLRYDPYSQAIWKLYAEIKYENLPLAVKIMFDYGHGLSGDELKEKYQLSSRTQVMRKVQEGIKILEQRLVSKLQSEERDNNIIPNDTVTP